MKTAEIVQPLIDWKGQTYAGELGIELKYKEKSEIFKWFLAAILFGAHISTTIAKNTFYQFEQHKLATVKGIAMASWDRLVEVLDAGGYTRFDFKTADKLMEVVDHLLMEYKGDLNLLHERSENSQNLSKRVQELGKGIGPLTVQIFLRELRGIWEKSQPPLSKQAVLCATKLMLLDPDLVQSERAVDKMKMLWKKSGNPLEDFTVFEAALLRVGNEFCQRHRCDRCQLFSVCKKAN